MIRQFRHRHLSLIEAAVIALLLHAYPEFDRVQTIAFIFSAHSKAPNARGAHKN